MAANRDETHVTQPKRSAAGVPSVARAVEYALHEMGPRRSLQALLATNQTHGFDCPSCAWPDPDHRKKAEFCENGAKAVAWEATRKRVDRAVLRRALDQLSCAISPTTGSSTRDG